MKVKTLREREKEHIQEVLRQTSWDLTKASALLRIPLPQLKRKITEHKLEPGNSSQPHTYN